MSLPTSETTTMKISEVKRRLSRLVNAVCQNRARFIIKKSGIPVAALVSIDDLERLARLDEVSAERWRVIEMMREPFRGIPSEEIEREAANAVAEVRAEMKAERDRDRVAKSA